MLSAYENALPLSREFVQVFALTMRAPSDEYTDALYTPAK